MACPYPEILSTPTLGLESRSCWIGFEGLPFQAGLVRAGSGYYIRFPSPRLVALLGYEPSMSAYLTIGGALFVP